MVCLADFDQEGKLSNVEEQFDVLDIIRQRDLCASGVRWVVLILYEERRKEWTNYFNFNLSFMRNYVCAFFVACTEAF